MRLLAGDQSALLVLRDLLQGFLQEGDALYEEAVEFQDLSNENYRELCSYCYSGREEQQ